MSILWYLGVCGAFFGGSFLLHQRSEVRSLKNKLEQTRAPQKIERNFRCHTV